MDNIDYHELRENIRKLKYKKRLTQYGIAKLLGVRNTYLSDMLNGRVPVTESVATKVSELISDSPSENMNPSEGLDSESILRSLIAEKDKIIALLEENATLLKKQVTLLEEKLSFLEEERTKKIERAVSSKKSVTTDAHAIFHQL